MLSRPTPPKLFPTERNHDINIIIQFVDSDEVKLIKEVSCIIAFNIATGIYLETRHIQDNRCLAPQILALVI